MNNNNENNINNNNNNNDNNNYNNLDNERYHFYPEEEWEQRGIVVLNDQNLTSLPPLPDNIKELYCRNNLLTSLPPLPDTLLILNCSNNQLTSIPPLPHDLLVLNFENNQVTEFPVGEDGNSNIMSQHLAIVACGNNRLKKLPNILSPHLSILSCENNRIEEIPALDFQIMSINFENNPLRTPYREIYNDYLNTGNLGDFIFSINQVAEIKSLKPMALQYEFNEKKENRNNIRKLRNITKYKQLFSRKKGTPRNNYVPNNIQNVITSFSTGIQGKTLEQQQNLVAKYTPEAQRYGITINPKQNPLNTVKNRKRLAKLLEEEKKYNEIGRQFEARQGGRRKTRKNRKPKRH